MFIGQYKYDLTTGIHADFQFFVSLGMLAADMAKEDDWVGSCSVLYRCCRFGVWVGAAKLDTRQPLNESQQNRWFFGTVLCLIWEDKPHIAEAHALTPSSGKGCPIAWGWAVVASHGLLLFDSQCNCRDHSISQPTNSERYLSCTRQWTCAKKCIFFMILSSAPSISTNARICSSISSWHPKNCLASSCHQSKCLDIKEMHGGASIDIHSALKPAVLACYHVSRFPQKVWVSASHQKFPDHPVIIHMPHEGGCVKLVWKVESLDRYI